MLSPQQALNVRVASAFAVCSASVYTQVCIVLRIVLSHSCVHSFITIASVPLATIAKICLPRYQFAQKRDNEMRSGLQSKRCERCRYPQETVRGEFVSRKRFVDREAQKWSDKRNKKGTGGPSTSTTQNKLNGWLRRIDEVYSLTISHGSTH